MNKKRNRPANTGSMDFCTCFNLRKAARAVTQSFDEAIRPAGLNANQLSLLAVLAGEAAFTMKQLAGVVVMDRTTLTRNLRPLERRGWVRIEAGEDRRERQVSLTTAGHRKFQEGRRRWRKAQARFQESLGNRGFARFLSDLATVVSTARAD